MREKSPKRMVKMLVNLKKTQINLILAALHDAADYRLERERWAQGKGREATTDETRAQWADMVDSHAAQRARYKALAAELREETGW